MALFSVSHLSIKHRLLLIILLVSFISVLITTISVTYLAIYNQKEQMANELELTASVVGERNQFALAIGRRDDVVANLQVFKLKPAITKACIYDVEGNVFARYPIEGEQVDVTDGGAVPKDMVVDFTCPKVTKPYTEFQNKELETVRILSMRGQKVGAIYVASDLRVIHEMISKQTFAAIFVIILACLVAYLLAKWLQRSIASPIQRLTEAATVISRNRNYGFRVQVFDYEKENDKDEMVNLLESFNDMLHEIEGRDETMQKQNIELERAKKVAEDANLAKSRFLASISHELRTPLNAIIGFSSIITGQLFGPVNSKYYEYAQDIHDSGAHLLEIINDILDLSKAEAGKLSLDVEEFDVRKALKKCFTLLEGRADAGGVKLVQKIPESITHMMADRVRFVQIILNIMSNAVKFTPVGGRVTLEMQEHEMHKKGKRIVIKVTDSGIGMSQADIEKAMQSFGQIDSGLNRRYEGTGLGLPLANKLMELHGGKLEIESELGAGTTVSLSFYSDADLQPFNEE